MRLRISNFVSVQNQGHVECINSRNYGIFWSIRSGFVLVGALLCCQSTPFCKELYVQLKNKKILRQNTKRNSMSLKKNSISCLKKSHFEWKPSEFLKQTQALKLQKETPEQPLPPQSHWDAKPHTKPTFFKRKEHSDKRLEEWITLNFFLEFSCPENPNTCAGNNPWCFTGSHECFTSSLQSALQFRVCTTKCRFPLHYNFPDRLVPSLGCCHSHHGARK